MTEPMNPQIDVQPFGASGRVRAMVVLPGGDKYIDKFDVMSFRGREQFIERLCDGRPGIDPAACRSKLEAIAADLAEPGDASDDGDATDFVSESQSTQLIELAEETFRFGQTEAGDVFAVRKKGAPIALMFRASRGSLRTELALQYFRNEHRVAGTSTIGNALLVLEGEARASEPEEVHLRVASHGDGIVLDLGGSTGEVVHVTGDGWEVSSQSPVLFRRTELTGVLPTPTRGGNLDDWRALLNLSDESWPIALAWVVAALMSDVPSPIAVLMAVQGAGKTTTAKLLVSVFDNGPAVLRSPPGDSEQWAMNLHGSMAVATDNISRIPEWWSDAMCRAVTGDGVVSRRLYTDDGLSVMAYRRVLLLSSIDTGALRGDLGDRVVMLDLQSISDSVRRDDKEIAELFRERHASILGAVLDLTSRVLRVLPNVHLARKSRMADFNNVLAAVDQVLGTSALSAYLDQRERVAEDVMESDPAAQLLREAVEEQGTLSGTAGQLRAELAPTPALAGWPRTDKAMGGMIRRCKVALEQVGIRVTLPADRAVRGKRRERIFFFEHVEGGQDPMGPMVPRSQTAVDGPTGRVPSGTVSEPLQTNGPTESAPSGPHEVDIGPRDHGDHREPTSPRAGAGSSAKAPIEVTAEQIEPRVEDDGAGLSSPATEERPSMSPPTGEGGQRA